MRRTPRHGFRLSNQPKKSLDAPLPLLERLSEIALPGEKWSTRSTHRAHFRQLKPTTPGFILFQEGATIRDLCKAHRDYGRDSPYFRGLLRSDLEAAVVIPADLRQLFSCLLDSTEFKLWEAAWRQLLREALPSLLTDPETAIDENGNALILEQLMGEGKWMDPTDQASSIPIKALQTIREHAVTAFFSMVPDGPIIPYYKIVQGTKEAFTKFVERLTRAIEVQVSEVAVREGILREMVFANVNNLCRTAILSLPLDPPPTLQDMLRVCQLKVPYMQGNDWDAKSTTPRVAAISGTQQEHICRPLELTKALYLKSVDWTFLSVNLKEQGAWPVQGKEFVVIGDCFELQEEKVQRMPPWKYLGLEIGKRTIVPQKLAIKTKWKDIPKKDRDGKDPLSIIEWVFLSHQRSKRMTRPQELVAELIRKARFRIRELAGWEKAGDAIKHLIHAFSFLGIPKELKTDNGPAYKSRELCSFLQQWGVEHKTGIPHSPTGQAMVERTHGTIKRVLHQQQRVLKAETPAVRLARALFTINFLNCPFEGLNPPIIRHFGASSLFSIRERPPVMVRDPESGRTEGPHDLVTWGRGYACVSTPTGPRWIPSKWVKPYVPKGSGSKTVISPQVADAAWRRKRKQGQHPWVEFPFPYCSYPE
ncbi:hypothetical protein DUI87_02086 [Hirundo rustica rustica]|uniref:Uncharacterized protein n=1 Tax=Hirundo rustica rustica TaxID=333673 RepID=A0A3M0L784_HIRRU|nr:hypothetical protein DUI87_02086 [Hirundo rustica rustica]